MAVSFTDLALLTGRRISKKAFNFPIPPYTSMPVTRSEKLMFCHKLSIVAAFVGLMLCGVHANATVFSLSQTFNDPSPTSSDAFGQGVAISGNNVLIGASGDDTNGVNVGQAHLFDAGTGALLQTFNDPTVTRGDRFGLSVALSGNNVLIGAFRDDTNGVNVGQAHLFDATTGALLQTFDDPTPTGGIGFFSGDNFGSSVAISDNNVLIGAYGHDINGVSVGQAHLFDAITGALLQTFDDPIVADSDSFGVSVALSGDNVLIGDPSDDTNGDGTGQAHIFDATTGALLQTFDDPTVTNNDNFGLSVALSGDNVLIGAPGDSTNGIRVGQAHLFDAITGALLQTFDDPTVTNNDGFGISVAINGSNVLIGAPEDSTNGHAVGQAHLFDATTGTLLHTFDDPTPTSSDNFGLPVALAGNNVLIGARSDSTSGSFVGQAYLFTLDATTGIPEPSTLVLLGLGVAGFTWMRRRVY